MNRLPENKSGFMENGSPLYPAALELFILLIRKSFNMKRKVYNSVEEILADVPKKAGWEKFSVDEKRIMRHLIRELAKLEGTSLEEASCRICASFKLWARTEDEKIIERKKAKALKKAAASIEETTVNGEKDSNVKASRRAEGWRWNWQKELARKLREEYQKNYVPREIDYYAYPVF